MPKQEAEAKRRPKARERPEAKQVGAEDRRRNGIKSTQIREFENANKPNQPLESWKDSWLNNCQSNLEVHPRPN
jgi:hypothetical protein